MKRNELNRCEEEKDFWMLGFVDFVVMGLLRMRSFFSVLDCSYRNLIFIFIFLFMLVFHF